MTGACQLQATRNVHGRYIAAISEASSANRFRTAIGSITRTTHWLPRSRRTQSHARLQPEGLFSRSRGCARPCEPPPESARRISWWVCAWHAEGVHVHSESNLSEHSFGVLLSQCVFRWCRCAPPSATDGQHFVLKEADALASRASGRVISQVQRARIIPSAGVPDSGCPPHP